MRKFLVIITLALLIVTSVQLWMTSDRTDQKKEMVQAQDRGEAQIGGDFTLTDHTGKAVHDSDFRGHIMLVYFGFTHCPDICPVTVGTVSKTMELLGDKADQVTPIFITVDPERDNPAALKDFLANFDKRFVGLTGTPEQIKQVASIYKTYFAKMPAAANDAALDYAVDHSGFIYMMGRDGKYIRIFPYNATSAEMAAAIKPYLN